MSVRTRYRIPLLFAALLLPALASARQEKVYQAYVEKDMDVWREVIDSMRRIQDPSLEQRENIVNFEYGYVAWALSCMETHKKEAQKYLTQGYADLSAYEKAGGAKARVAAYRSAFIAYDMKLHPAKIPFVGLKSISDAKTALKHDPSDFFPKIQYGNVMYYLPAGLGGSKAEALVSYKQALLIMERQGQTRHWMYLNLLLTLAEIYKSKGQYQVVQAYYDKILRHEPGFTWVRDSLVPANQARLRGER